MDTSNLLDRARNVLAGLGLVSTVALVAGGLFLAGELRNLVGPDPGFGEPLGLTHRAKKAKRVVETCTDPRTGATAPLVVRELGDRARKAAAADYGVRLASEGDKPSPAAASAGEPASGAPGASAGHSGGWFHNLFRRDESATRAQAGSPPVYDLLAEVKVGPIIGRRNLAAMRNRTTGDVELRQAKAPAVEWVHLVRYRLALELDNSSLAPTESGEVSAEWIPARVGIVYAGLEGFYRQFDSAYGERARDPGVRLTLTAFCSGAFRCGQR